MGRVPVLEIEQRLAGSDHKADASVTHMQQASPESGGAWIDAIDGLISCAARVAVMP